MLQLSKPRKPTKDNPDTWYTPEKYPEKFAKLTSYCADDIRAERDLDKHLPEVSESEWELWCLSEKINDFGVFIDIEALDNLQALIKEYKAELATECVKRTGFKPTQREEIANWIRANGYSQLTDLQAETVKSIVRSAECPEPVKLVLRIYSTYGAKAVTKLDAIKKSVCGDGRLRGCFMFYGAATTGRWSAKIANPQSLFRPVIDDTDEAIAAAAFRDLNLIRWEWPGVDPIKVFASCTRGMFRSPPGRILRAMDYRGIESRWTAWMFEENWKIKAFEAFDRGDGPDMYIKSWSELFLVPVDKVTPEERQKAKPIELAFGFEGGTGALITFSENTGVNLDELAKTVWDVLTPEAMDSAHWMYDKFGRSFDLKKDTYLACEAIKYMWREKHPKHKAGWKLLKDAAISAVQNPGKVYGLPNKKVLFKVVGRWLVVLLPSGRRLRYFEPRVTGEGRDAVCTYLGVDTETRRFMRTSTYGGKWTENIAQGGSSDFLRHGILKLDAAGHEIVMTLHDEAVNEVDEDFLSLDGSIEIYADKPAWAKGFPLAASGYEAIRFKKD